MLRISKPRGRILLGTSGQKIISIRWGRWGIDYFRLSDFKLVQFGSKLPLLFLCKTKELMPIFLVSVNWKITHTFFKRYHIGTTRKPLKTDLIWRSICQQDSARANSGISMNTRISSGTGSITLIKG